MIAGQRIPAGYGFATVFPDFDFETYSEAGYQWNEQKQRWAELEGMSVQKRGLKAVGTRAYVEHPSFELLSLYWDLKDGHGGRHWKPGDPDPFELFQYILSGGLIEAWNSGFEWQVWTYYCVPVLHWPPLQLEQLRCAMSKCRAFAGPGKLEKAGQVFKAAVLKDPNGDRLLKKFSVPRNPTKADPRRRLDPRDDPIDGPKLYAYNGVDIQAEAAVSILCPDVSPFELDLWKLDQRINDRGVYIDLPSVDACIKIIQQAHAKYNAELRQLTGGAVETASQAAALIVWLKTRGVFMASMEAEEVELALKTPMPPEARRALEIRQLISSASVKKVFSMRAHVSSLQRLHDLFSYYAARTGRWTGNDAQPQNLPKSGPNLFACEACEKHYGLMLQHCPYCGATSELQAHSVEWTFGCAEEALALIQAGSLDLLEMYYGDAIAVIGGCLRGLFIAAPGKELICSDYSAIEAVVLAALAGEEWRLEVFRTHGRIYETAAAKITGKTLQFYLDHKKSTGSHHPDRGKIGKIFELALGYQGWIGAALAFGAGDYFPDDEIKKLILAWRAASPNIEEFWGGQFRGLPWLPGYRAELYGIEGAAISAVLNPGSAYACRGIVYQMHGDVLYCQLLSGRLLVYHRPRLAPATRGIHDGALSLSYEGWNTNPKNGPSEWIRMETYGGKLVENLVQATARDILAHGMLNLDRAGYPIVLHVHDEPVAEVPAGYGSIEEFEACINDLPDWAKGWPIKAAGGWRGLRYRKD